jgi:hypothetical protein
MSLISGSAMSIDRLTLPSYPGKNPEKWIEQKSRSDL